MKSIGPAVFFLVIAASFMSSTPLINPPPVFVDGGTIGIVSPIGQSQMADSVSVAIASDQGAVPIEETALKVQRTGYLDGHVSKFYQILGRRTLGYTDTSTFQDVSGYLDTSQAANTAVSPATTYYIRSSSASDTGAGTGTRSVRIIYLNNVGALASMTVGLTGTTAVSIGSGISYIEWMESASCGSGGVSAGDITISSVTGAPTVAQTIEKITAGGNRSLSGRFKVPAGYSGYVNHMRGTAISSTQDLRLRGTVFSDDRSLSDCFHFQAMLYLASGHGEIDLPFYKFPALSEIKCSTISNAAAAGNRSDCSFDIVVIQN